MSNFKLSENKQLDWLRIRHRVIEYFKRIEHDYDILEFFCMLQQDYTYLFVDENDYFLVLQVYRCPFKQHLFLSITDAYAPNKYDPVLVDKFAKEKGCNEVRWWTPRLGALRHPKLKKYFFNAQFRREYTDDDPGF